MTKRFYQSIASLTHAIREASDQIKNGFEWFRSRSDAATKQDLKEMETRIMSVISEFYAKQKDFNNRIDAGIEGVSQDVQELKDKIDELQNSPGGITPEDQALLDDLQARSEGIATKLEALDALTPPKPPVEDPEA